MMLCNQILQIFQTISDQTKIFMFHDFKDLPHFLVSEIYPYVFGQILSYRVFSLDVKIITAYLMLKIIKIEAYFHPEN